MKDINLLQDQLNASQLENTNSTKLSTKQLILIISIVVLMGASYAVPVIANKYLDSKIFTLNKEVNDKKYVELNEIKTKIGTSNSLISNKKAIITNIEGESNKTNDIIEVVLNSIPKTIKIDSMQVSGNKVSITCVGKSEIEYAQTVSSIERLSIVVPGSTFKSFNPNEKDGLITFKIDFTIGKGGK